MPDAPAAIVAGNDAQAFGVLQALAERGRRCPDDLSVTGFNVALDDADHLADLDGPVRAVRLFMCLAPDGGR